LAGRVCRSARLKSCHEGNPAFGGITGQGAFSFVPFLWSKQRKVKSFFDLFIFPESVEPIRVARPEAVD
jgi:hypothetical protein